MTTTAELAEFVHEVTYDGLPSTVVDATKRRLLDAVGVAYGARERADAAADRVSPLARSLAGESAGLAGVSATVEAEGGDACARIATGGGRAGPSGAAMDGTARVRALDYADAFFAPEGPTHPSDAVAACVAAAERADADGETLVAALAAAYEVHSQLAWHAPVRERGFHPAAHSLVSATCGAAVALDLDVAATRSALDVAVSGHAPLDVPTDDGWAPLPAANAAREAVYAAMLAANGVAGPRDAVQSHPVFGSADPGVGTTAERDDGHAEEDGHGHAHGDAHDADDPGHIFVDRHAVFDLDPACEGVTDVAAKRHVGPFALQSAVSVVADLASAASLDADDVERLTVGTFDPLTLPAASFDAADVETPATAVRSLPYAVAAAFLDGAFGPAQCAPERLRSADVRALADRVAVEERPGLTTQFEAGLAPAVADVELADGTTHHAQVGAFPGHPTQPMDWDAVAAKVRPLVADVAGEDRADAVVRACRRVDEGDVSDFLDAVA